MEKITGEKWLELMKENFPKFLPYWEVFIQGFGLDAGITFQMMPFGEYTIDVVKSNDELELKKIFDFVEFLLCRGDESLKNAIATGYLEYLLNKDPAEIKFYKIAKYLGENSIGYCKAWDEFTSTTREGLW